MIDPHGEDRFDRDRALIESRLEQVAEKDLLAFELIRVRDVLPVASATGPEMAAQWRGHGG